MSEENVEVIRRLYAAAEDRDADAVFSLYDPEVEIDVSRTHRALMQDIYAGPDHEGLLKWSREWHEAWENVSYDVEELVDAGERVVGVVTVRGRGRGSGAEVEFTRHAGLWTIRDGRVSGVVWFKTRADALKTAGLSE